LIVFWAVGVWELENGDTPEGNADAGESTDEDGGESGSDDEDCEAEGSDEEMEDVEEHGEGDGAEEYDESFQIKPLVISSDDEDVTPVVEQGIEVPDRDPDGNQDYVYKDEEELSSEDEELNELADSYHDG